MATSIQYCKVASSLAAAIEDCVCISVVPSSIAAASELATAYNTGSALACEHSLLTGDLSGDTLSGGVYCSGSGMNRFYLILFYSLLLNSIYYIVQYCISYQ